MQYTIKSQDYCAKINSLGAELCSMTDKENNEYIWTADDVWKRHAPLLFPFVCNTKSKKYTVNGTEYALSNHGFVRDTEFECINTDENSVTLKICSNEETLKKYPYSFELTVKYTICGNTLNVSCTADNKGTEDMPFFIGGHPGFICPFTADKDSSFDDYEVVYDKPETIIQQLETGNVTVLDNGTTVKISRELFKNDVFLKDKPASSSVSLVSMKSGKSVTVSYDNSGCIAVWSPYDERGTFVCLEPWAAAPVYCCDTEELTQMPHAKHIAAGESFTFKFDITIK